MSSSPSPVLKRVALLGQRRREPRCAAGAGGGEHLDGGRRGGAQWRARPAPRSGGRARGGAPARAGRGRARDPRGPSPRRGRRRASACSAARRCGAAARAASPPSSKWRASTSGSRSPCCSSHSPAQEVARRAVALGEHGVGALAEQGVAEARAPARRRSGSPGAAPPARASTSCSAQPSAGRGAPPRSAVTPPGQNTSPKMLAARSTRRASASSRVEPRLHHASTVSGSERRAAAACGRRRRRGSAPRGRRRCLGVVDEARRCLGAVPSSPSACRTSRSVGCGASGLRRSSCTLRSAQRRGKRAWTSGRARASTISGRAPESASAASTKRIEGGVGPVEILEHDEHRARGARGGERSRRRPGASARA